MTPTIRGAIVVAALLTVTSLGQNSPLPTTSPLRFAGRYVDSATTQNFQGGTGISTIRARTIRTVPGKIAIQMGNAVAVYNSATFQAKLAGGMRLVSAARESERERYLAWDGFMYPEAAASKWYAPVIDGQDPMGSGTSFDLDDRGYIYGAWRFGWGIAKDDGRTNGTHFPKIVQVVNCGGSADAECPAAVVSPVKYPNTRHDGSGMTSRQSIASLKVGSSYYAIVASGSGKGWAVWDVTDAAAPRHIATRPGIERSVLHYDRTSTHFATVDATGRLHVYTHADAVAGRAPIATYPNIINVSIDESGAVWGLERARILRRSPAGVATYYPLPDGFTVQDSRGGAISVAGGHMAVSGLAVTRFDVRVAKVGATSLQWLELGGFFASFYYTDKAAYTYPFDVQLATIDGKLLMLYSALGLGDVYEIAGSVAPPVVDPPQVDPPVTPPVCMCPCVCRP